MKSLFALIALIGIQAEAAAPIKIAVECVHESRSPFDVGLGGEEIYFYERREIEVSTLPGTQTKQIPVAILRRYNKSAVLKKANDPIPSNLNESLYESASLPHVWESVDEWGNKETRLSIDSQNLVIRATSAHFESVTSFLDFGPIVRTFPCTIK